MTHFWGTTLGSAPSTEEANPARPQANAMPEDDSPGDLVSGTTRPSALLVDSWVDKALEGDSIGSVQRYTGYTWLLNYMYITCTPSIWASS